MSTLSQFAGGIKSVQRGTVTIADGVTSGSVTIAAVNPSKAIVNNLGHLTSNTSISSQLLHIALTNSTTVTATRQSAPSYTSTVSYEVIEFY